MKVLLTGGYSNSIGLEVIHQLLHNNIQVVVVDELKEIYPIFPLSIVPYYQQKIEKDSLLKILVKEKATIIIHLKQEKISDSIKESFEASENNIAATIDVLEASAAANVKKIIFSSSISVYGESEELLTENSPLQPLQFEGISKKIEEQYIKNYHLLYGLTYTILRFAAIYELNKKDTLTDGKKDGVYIKDGAAAIIASLNQGDNEFFNILSMTTRADKSRISIEKAKKMLCWKPSAYSFLPDNKIYKD
ncbi:hypothetical protein NCCP28_08120 [Niallia sp. NCCP-28]|nr:hypothetical protein NCCP28_08120 [Niallia sp. NCCP-28]